MTEPPCDLSRGTVLACAVVCGGLARAASRTENCAPPHNRLRAGRHEPAATDAARVLCVCVRARDTWHTCGDSLSRSHRAHADFNPCRTLTPDKCWAADFADVADGSLASLTGSYSIERMSRVTGTAKWSGVSGGGFTAPSGELRSDNAALTSPPVRSCDSISGTVLLLKDADVVTTRNRYVRTKFRFNSAGGCAGLVVNYKSPSDFFVISVCRLLGPGGSSSRR